jgi:adenine specific DNA methylase Mod
MSNHLYYGDNLSILQEVIAPQSIDLVYLDPPFNSSADYNILFKSPESTKKSSAQVEAFKDTWHWGEEAETAYHDVLRFGNTDVSEMLRSMRIFMRENDMMAYLAMMTIRLLYLHRALKDTGSLYLHCDPTASHYLKILLDAVFGKQHFRNEITWKRSTAHSDGNRWGRNADILFYYTKSDSWTWNQVYTLYDEEWIARFSYKDADGRKWRDGDLSAKGLTGGGYTYEYKGATSLWRVPPKTMQRLDAEGRLHFTNKGGIRLKRYLDETKGYPVQAIWDDIPPINSQSKERLGYPTQKPVALLERILAASSNEGDVVLDPFCGCGTAVHAAEKLNRRWVGIDITNLAISLIEKRLTDAFPAIQFNVHGVPKDMDGARALANKDKYQFQWWAVSLVEAVPFGGKKKGADGGIDGLIYFSAGKDSKTGKERTEKAVVSVKGGDNVSVAMIRDLGHVMEREKAPIGVFITLASPTEPMLREAVKMGWYEHEDGRRYPRLQILSIDQLFNGAKPQIPLIDRAAFKKAELESRSMQGKLGF